MLVFLVLGNAKVLSFISGFFSVVSACEANCEVCSSVTVCTTCVDRYYLSNDSCSGEFTTLSK